MGNFFVATLDARRDEQNEDLPNELASFNSLIKFGFQPQRVALWIYWQAVVLLWKGVAFYSPPNSEIYKCTAEAAASHPKLSDGKYFRWKSARGWPWVALGSTGCLKGTTIE